VNEPRYNRLSQALWQWLAVTAGISWLLVLLTGVWFVGLAQVKTTVAATPLSTDHQLMDSKDINTAANQLLVLVKQWVSADSMVPPFARERIAWITDEQRAGRLSIILLKDISNTNLDFEALMAAGEVDGRNVIVIAQPRFADFLIDGGRTSPPFTRQQMNDFMLGLVHESLHFERSALSPTLLEDRLAEETRVWREVDTEVVQKLRELHQPMNERFIEADNVIRSCAASEPCPGLAALLFPSESRRH
jgi:hypothetical protein